MEGAFAALWHWRDFVLRVDEELRVNRCRAKAQIVWPMVAAREDECRRSTS
jgi:hypothetical protein